MSESIGAAVAAVNSEDLERVWTIMNFGSGGGAEDAGGCIAFDQAYLLKGTTHEVDLDAVHTRCALLDLLGRRGVLAAWRRGPHLESVVFRVAARFALPRGVSGLDIEEFLSELRREGQQTAPEES